MSVFLGDTGGKNEQRKRTSQQAHVSYCICCHKLQILNLYYIFCCLSSFALVSTEGWPIAICFKNFW